MNVFLYPVNARHTKPLVCGMAKAMAKCHVACDIVTLIELSEEEVHNHAVASFKAFCENQEVDCLTDDMEALETMYTSAYEQMYHTRYAEVIADLERIAKERNANCAD